MLAAQGHAPAAHHLQIIAALEAVERGEAERLLLLLPPGSAKSTFASLLFPAWWMARHPTSSVICACHTVGLAQRFSRSVRGLLMEHGPRLNVSLRGDARAAAHFLTEQGGEYFGVGVHGAVTGRRADLALIDDPVRSFADAESGGARERVWNWFRSDLLTRLKPGGRTVIVIQRSFDNNFPFVTAARGSTTALALMNHGDGQYALSIDTGITDVMLEVGRNDIQQYVGVTATQVEQYIQSIATRYTNAGKRCWCFSIPPTTYSNDAWTTVANQSFPFAAIATGSATTASGATTIGMSSVATLTAGLSVALNGSSNTPAQAIPPRTVIVSVNSSASTITISPPTAASLPAGTKLYFGTNQPLSSPVEAQREQYNGDARTLFSTRFPACTGLIDVDSIVADQAGSGKWRTDLGQASADGVHPSTVLHQAIINAGVLSPSRFTAP